MESELRNKVAQLASIECRFGWSARTIVQDDDGVRVSIAREEGPGTDVLEADYVVGCDGARSVVREEVGIERGGTDFDQSRQGSLTPTLSPQAGRGRSRRSRRDPTSSRAPRRTC
jgi:2-polyprenyl-6-methoxyphenol hydroxylase-like FAD-dependent oxidoreductase